MKKDLIFAPVMLVIGALLCMLKLTGPAAHIAISVAGILVLGVYTSATKKQWKIPVLEVLMRVFYGLALITGIIIMNVAGIAALAIGHRVCAAAFLLLLVVLFVHKLATKNAK